MAKLYSHSKISTFEQCPKKYKFRYIDKIKPEVEKSIEAHLGSAVHNALEWLYTKVKQNTIPTVDELIMKYSSEWKKDFSKNIQITNKELTFKDYFNKGIEFLVSYYMKHHPFDDNTIELEKKIYIELDENKNYKIQGFIDRLSYNLKTKEYEIHDYKTANSLPTLEKLEKDRQLALYSIAIKNLYGKEKEVKLIWHFLAHNKKVHIKKTDKQLEELKSETLRLIKKIENTTEFYPVKSRLCDWCEYKSICPAWNSPEQIKQNMKRLTEKNKNLQNKNQTANYSNQNKNQPSVLEQSKKIGSETSASFKKQPEKPKKQNEVDKYPTLKKYLKD